MSDDFADGCNGRGEGMNAMTIVTAPDVQWFAVRMRPNENGGPRTATVDIKREAYVNRSGRKAHRNVKGTGKRVFMPEHLVKRAGFDVFLPVKKVWRKKNRFSDARHLVAVPLLADWMFVCLPVSGEGCFDGWMKLMDLNVVAGVMSTGGRPIQISDATMMRMMTQFGSGRICPKVKRRVAERRVVGVGDVATILEGHFDGFECRVVDVSGVNAKVMLDIFGRDTPTELLLSSLSKLDGMTSAR